MQKYLALFTDVPYQASTVNRATKNETARITVAPYLAGTVNHATKNEMAKITVAPCMACVVNHAMNNGIAKITDPVYLARGTVKEREDRIRSKRVLEGTEKLLKRENQGEKQEEHVRRQCAMMSTEQ